MSSAVAKIVLVAGAVKIADRVGHHDYLAGCRLLAFLLAQMPGVRAVTVRDGWPTDPRTFDDADAILFYAGGLTKHPLAGSSERLARLGRCVDAGAGLVMIHQAVRCPPAVAERVRSWIGGVHEADAGRGHWPTSHAGFPSHPVTSGVEPWTITDGWLNEIRFVDGARGVTPLVWSSRSHGGSPAGGPAAIAAWTFERPGGGRAFCFTGVDAHAAWSVPGVRRMILNGILWSAGVAVPEAGAACGLDGGLLNGFLTPRTPVARWSLQRFGRRLRRLALGA